MWGYATVAGRFKRMRALPAAARRAAPVQAAALFGVAMAVRGNAGSQTVRFTTRYAGVRRCCGRWSGSWPGSVRSATAPGSPPRWPRRTEGMTGW
ncbi:MAG TPA: hypothetical protein VFZ32_03520 [Micromonosporaceae bacterium]